MKKVSEIAKALVPGENEIRAILRHANDTGHVQGLRSYLRRTVVDERLSVECERMLDGVLETVARIAWAHGRRDAK